MAALGAEPAASRKITRIAQRLQGLKIPGQPSASVVVTHDQGEAFEVAGKISAINHGRIEQVGTASEIHDHPATPFVMTFVGEVNVLPSELHAFSSTNLFARPHDLELLRESQDGSVPAMLRRITHLG